MKKIGMYEANCTHCGKVFPLTELKPLPSVEAYVRAVATQNPDAEKMRPTPEESKVLLCPDCLKKHTLNSLKMLFDEKIPD